MVEPTGSTYTGVNEYIAGKKKGIVKCTVMKDYGVYETLAVKLGVQYRGHNDDLPCEHPLKVTITLPEKWLDNPTPASTLKAYFLKAYRKKHPAAPLSLLDEEDVNLAIKDESLFGFSRELLADQAILTDVLYDRQDVWCMGPDDWDAMEEALASARKVVVDALQHTLKSVTLKRPEQIVPVVERRQLVPGNCYVVLVGWYKQQCVIVTPEMTVADLKAYLHHKNGARLPMESLDIGMRDGDSIDVLDDGWSLNRVYQDEVQRRQARAGHLKGDGAADAARGEAGGSAEGGGSGKGGEGGEGGGLIVRDSDAPEAPDLQGKQGGALVQGAEGRVAGVPAAGVGARGFGGAVSSGGGAAAGRGGGGDASGGDGLIEDGISQLSVAEAGSGSGEGAAEAKVEVPAFFGQTMMLGVGKRVQDRKHQIWLPSVHDPYSFRAPDDDNPQGGSSAMPATHTPKGWAASGQPSVGQDENCSIM